MQTRARMIAIVTVGLCVGLRAAPQAQQPPRPTIPDVPLGSQTGTVTKEVVRDMCGSQVVLLGESPTHGFGKTMKFKAELVRALIEGCHFNTVLFESGIYDFMHIQTQLDSGREVTRGDVAAAIGDSGPTAMWNRSCPTF